MYALITPNACRLRLAAGRWPGHSGPVMQRTAYCLPILALAFAGACQPKPDAASERALEHRPSEIPQGVATVGEAIEYSVSFDDAVHHYISVRAVYPAPANSDVELSMAVWTPGSYLVREYARHIEGLQFVTASGKALKAVKNSKNRWRVHTGETPGLVAEYKVYCRELSVRSNFVDADAAVLNGAPTFLTMEGEQRRAHKVQLTLPEDWKGAVTALDRADPSSKNHFVAKSYDELVDSPIIAGRDLVIGEFQVEGVPHRLVHLGDSSQWNLEETLADVERLTRTEVRLWGVVPYEHYDFLNVILGGGGGLEHLDSTLMLSRSFTTRTAKGYRGWLGLVSHEFFHTWNVKRLRPEVLGPFDYENENYTRSLWIAEGITSYYDDLLLRRAGLMDEEQYLERLSEQIQRLQESPGRLVQSLAQSSYDSWIKFYRRDENSINTSISYYTKGAVLAFLLDVEIRIANGGSKSLDDLMRLLYRRHSGDKGYTPEEFRAAASQVAGVDLSAFFDRGLDSTEELDYRPALDYYGLEFSDTKDEDEADEEEEEEKPAGWLGLSMSGDAVRRVKRGTPAFVAGLNVNDEILAIDGYRNSAGLDDLLEKFRPEQEVTITISRRGRLRELKASLATEPEKTWTLSEAKDRSGLQTVRYRQWLAEDSDP